MHIPDLTHAFGDGAIATEPDGKQAHIVVEDIGSLTLTTGQVVACDPFCIVGHTEIEPFTVTVPPGRYPVQLSTACFRNVGQYWYKVPRVAYAMTRFSERLPIRWEIARPCLHADGRAKIWDPAYPVDAGTGCVADVVAAQALKRWLEADASNHDEMVMLSYWAHEAGRQWMQITPAPALKANVIMFDSGWGDGMYSSYFGYDGAGEITCLVTDFKVFDEKTTFA